MRPVWHRHLWQTVQAVLSMHAAGLHLQTEGGITPTLCTPQLGCTEQASEWPQTWARGAIWDAGCRLTYKASVDA